MNSLSLLLQDHQGFSLRSADPRELLVVGHALEDVYTYYQGEFTKVLLRGQVIDSQTLPPILEKTSGQIFMTASGLDQVRAFLKEKLIDHSRSLSVGDSEKNAVRLSHLLTLNMATLYDRPNDDEILQLQFHSAVNLGKYALENPKVMKQSYESVLKQGHHFTHAQPLLSSLFLLGFLSQLHQFRSRELENLFLVSYLKDIGFSALPLDLTEKSNLNGEEKKLIDEHAFLSASLIESRLPLTQTHLHMIRYHHVLNDGLQRVKEGLEVRSNENFSLVGAETILTSAVDAVVAMISARPYREPLPLFDALQLIKEVLGEKYSTEFKILVNFARKFLA